MLNNCSLNTERNPNLLIQSRAIKAFFELIKKTNHLTFRNRSYSNKIAVCKC